MGTSVILAWLTVQWLGLLVSLAAGYYAFAAVFAFWLVAALVEYAATLAGWEAS